MTPKIFVLDSAIVPHTAEVAIEAEVLDGYADVRLLHLRDEEEFAPYAPEAAGLILWHQVKISGKTIRRLTQARILVRNGVGYESVDTEAAALQGIPVANVPDYGTEEVADHAMALCLALTRQLRPFMDDIAKGNWRYEAGLACRRTRGQVFGIIGCGRIGTAVALRAKCFGYDVRFYDPYVPAGYEKAIGLSREANLADLLRDSGIVSIHAPLTAETLHLIDSKRLRLMKPDAYLINTARGPIIRYADLERALTEKWIQGAGLDVLEDEPHGKDLASRFANCIVTPHAAFYSQESILEMRRSAARLVRDVLLHNRFANVVSNGCGASSRHGAFASQESSPTKQTT